MRHGKGATVWKGAKYDGKWFNDMMHGVGSFTTEHVHFSGNFKNGSWHGDGSVHFKSGFRKKDVYEGHFVAGYMQKYGVYTYSDGRVFKGSHLNSLQFEKKRTCSNF